MMRPCPTCGANTAETDDFCGNCGSYLGWDATVKKPVPPPPQQPPQPPPGQPPAPPAPPGPYSAPGPPPGGRPGPAPGRHALPDPEPAQPEPEDDQPAAVQPAKPVAPRPESQTVVPTTPQDGPPCRSCGTPNPPDRRFCVRCATQLIGPEPEPTRWLSRKRRNNNGLGWLWRRLTILSVILALVIGGYLLFPFGQWAVQDILDKTMDASNVEPAKITASSEMSGHPATAAVDEITNQGWGTTDVGEWIEFEFDPPFRLLNVLVTTGPTGKSFEAQARPTRMEAVITDANGVTQSHLLQLAAAHEAKPFSIRVSDVRRIRLVVHETTGVTSGKHIELGEVEFQKRGN
ncbi:hypothetical protein [Saccharopolyspora gloriosae]|uniref:hypothetical protein n=1 Tax=Saccharopolyspora gloriosae TaxID=455344 RepID=UPI001FB5B9C6|nr:hypothetical protein [Saccharopolyspora gloriosae]